MGNIPELIESFYSVYEVSNVISPSKPHGMTTNHSNDKIKLSNQVRNWQLLSVTCAIWNQGPFAINLWVQILLPLSPFTDML